MKRYMLLICCIIMIMVSSVYASGAQTYNGKIKWKAMVKGGTPSDVAIGKGGFLFFSIHSGNFEKAQEDRLYAVSSADGRVVWGKVISRAQTIWPTPTPAVDSGVVYAATYEGKLLAFRGMDGEELWSFQAEITPSYEDQFVASSPLVSGSVIYAVFGDYMYAIDKATGKQQWKVSAGYSPSAPLMLSDGRIFAYRIGEMIALDIVTGKTLWSMPTSGNASMLVNDGIIYVGDCYGKVKSIDAATGKTIWSTKQIGRALTDIAVYGKTLFVLDSFGVGGSLLAINKDNGKVIWKHLPVSGYNNPVIDSNGILFAALVPKLVAMDVNTRKLIWAHDLHLGNNPFAYSSPAIRPDGTLYMLNGEINVSGFKQGILYAISQKK